MAELLPEETDAVHPPARRWLWWLIALGVTGVTLVCLCVLAVGLPSARVSPVHQQLAQQALRNPASAPLHLGNYGDVNGWWQAGPLDYAVQDGMVIFPPATLTNLIPMFPDIRLSVLVYAPDGSDLSLRPGPPPDRSWFYGNEWFLYDCRSRPLDPLWWDCMLLVGGNI